MQASAHQPLFHLNGGISVSGAPSTSNSSSSSGSNHNQIIGSLIDNTTPSAAIISSVASNATDNSQIIVDVK